MTTDEVRELGRWLREFAESADEDGDVGMAADMKQAAATLERLADDKLATEVAQGPGHHTLDREGAILAYRKRVMGED